MRIAIVNYSVILSDMVKRLEAEFYTAYSQNTKEYYLGEDIIDFLQYGTSEELNEEDKGFPILRLNEFNSLFIGKPAKFSDKIDLVTFESLTLKKNDVLICRTNGNPNLVGRAAIVPKDYSFAFASYLFRVRPKRSLIFPAVLAVYLNSKNGRKEIDKYSMVSNQTNFSPAKFREILIPKFEIRFQNIIEQLVFLSFRKHEESNQLYLQAEQILLSELGLLNWKPNHQLSFVRNYSDTESAERTDAEYFQPIYDEITGYIKCYENGSDLLRSQFKQNKKTFKIEPEREYQYVEIGCVNISDGSIDPLQLRGDKLPANAKIKLLENDLIVSTVRPYRGAIGIVDNSSYVGSGAFTVLQECGEVNKETLMVFLRSKPMLSYSLKFNTGTSYPTITDSDILNFTVPIIKNEKQEQIKIKLTESRKAKYISRKILEIAKRGVEIAIEKDETEARKWINEELLKCQVEMYI